MTWPEVATRGDVKFLFCLLEKHLALSEMPQSVFFFFNKNNLIADHALTGRDTGMFSGPSSMFNLDYTCHPSKDLPRGLDGSVLHFALLFFTWK